LGVVSAGAALACGGVDEVIEPAGELTGAEATWAGEICYRGERVWATRSGDDLFVEGDIVVGARDQWCDEGLVSEEGIGTVTEALKIQGAEYQWPGAVVHYAFDSSFDATDQSTAIAAMKAWEDVVPGLSFVARTSQSDYITFVKDASSCSSSVGRQGGAQSIKLTSSCLGSYAVHHEIGHALGVFHQHTRKDRDDFVSVVWANIQGCPSTATQYSHCGATACASNLADCGCTAATHDNGSCYKAHNFRTNSSRSNIGEYDYDSVMHYPVWGFRKSGAGNTLEVLLTDDSGTPFAIGQRNHLSAGDIAAMRAMYPTLSITRSIFSGKGSQSICALLGRTEDIAVQYLMTGSSSGITAATVNRSLMTPGDYNVLCNARSSFWDDNYDYPNSSEAFDSSATLDSYSRSTTMRVLSPALVPALM
jgi:hypothetical protein